MAINPESDRAKEKPDEPVIPEPTGDGFPAEKDVSSPPPGTDEATDKDSREEKIP